MEQSGKVTLRVGRRDFSRVGIALAVSLVAHLIFWGGYATASHFKLTSRWKLPKWVQRLIVPPPQQQAKVQPPTNEPYIFIDVRAAQAVAEPPKNAIRYSDRNAIAANPDNNKDSNEPKVEGEQNELQKLDDSGRRKPFDQLMPDPPKPAPDVTPSPAPAPGTMTVAKADLKSTEERQRQRPRTIREAMLQKSQTPGKRSQIDGGASRPGNVSFDVRATGFGAYDRLLIDAVSDRWYNLLDNLSYEGYRQGKVVVQFNLNYRGEISDVKIIQNTVTEMLALMCEKAIRDPAPFGEWSREMRLAVGDDYRRITFTFHYH